MLYAILERSRWDGRQPVSTSPGACIVHASRVAARVDDFTGRGFVLGYRSVADSLRRSGRVFVAADRKHPEGVLVERVA